MVSIVAISTPEPCVRGQRVGGEVQKYRAMAGREATTFFAGLACIADAAHHPIVRRDRDSLKRIDMTSVICARALLRRVN
jgi:hypothetical protein